ncbi:MAG: MlaD family protein [Synechococcales bacterium]|nr:MlaD family protein [Synechococcales bacterium]
MRSRTVREGTVGLLILGGLALFGGLILWLRGLDLGNRSYRFGVSFDTVAGMQPGAPVRYRGVTVGRIQSVQPQSNEAQVVVQINSAELQIPREVRVEANQEGLIGETSIDIVPLEELSAAALDISPLAKDCDPTLILCNGITVEGVEGVNYTTLIRTTASLAERFNDPELIAEIESLVSNTSQAAAGIAELSDEVTDLTEALQEDLGLLASSATGTVDAVTQAANRFSATADEITALVAMNQTTLTRTLRNLELVSTDVQRIVVSLAPVVEEGELIENLETLSANAVVASENLRSLTDSLNNAETITQLQRTLDSAYETFENARKITADLDELTGDPEFRSNVRELVNGLSSLVSTTQQLQQQTELAQLLAAAIAHPATPDSASVQPGPSIFSVEDRRE